jgi:hypothetical protein
VIVIRETWSCWQRCRLPGSAGLSEADRRDHSPDLLKNLRLQIERRLSIDFKRKLHIVLRWTYEKSADLRKSIATRLKRIGP